MKIKITYSAGEEVQTLKLAALIRSMLPKARQHRGKKQGEYNHIYFSDRPCKRENQDV